VNNDVLKSRMPLILFGAYFIYSSAVALLIQLVILPHFLPQIHLGHGLCIGDAMSIHEWAGEAAAKMREQGWAAWDLYPQSQLTGGIASVFYYLIASEPWAMIPYNAFLHASAGVLLYLILKRIGLSSLPAGMGSMVFVLNPTSLEWVAQMQKDGMFILGNYLVFWGVIGREANTWKAYTSRMIPVAVLASFCFYLSRPYWYQILSVILLGLIPVLLIHAFFNGRDGRESFNLLHWKIMVGSFCCLVCFWAADQGLVQREIQAGNPRLTFRYVPEVPIQIEMKQSATQQSATQQSATQQSATQQSATQQRKGDNILAETPSWTGGYYAKKDDFNWIEKKKVSCPFQKWEKTGFFPDFIERRMFTIWSTRGSPLLTPGGSKVDRDADLSSFWKIIAYLPRAVQVGWLSPFPDLWTGQGSSAAMTLVRPMVGAMTLVCWLFLAMALGFVWKNRSRVEVLSLLYLCVGAVAIFALVYPVVGTLIRFRYGFYMVGVSLGIAFLVEKIMLWQKSKSESVLTKEENPSRMTK